MRRIPDIEELEDRIVNAFERFRPRKIILFGSVGRGDWDEHSDVDVLVVYPTEKRFLDRLEELYLAWSIPVAVDILAYTPEEFKEMLEDSPFVQDIAKEGRIIYEWLGEGGETLDSAGA
jgi:predicted nucleotidyltransferase